jgi:hypothetical protein
VRHPNKTLEIDLLEAKLPIALFAPTTPEAPSAKVGARFEQAAPSPPATGSSGDTKSERSS